MADSTVTIVGNLTRDPEIRYTTGGAAKASFGVAVSRRWQNRQSNEWEEQTSFFNVVCWREMAENVSESIRKLTNEYNYDWKTLPPPSKTAEVSHYKDGVKVR